MAKNIIKEIIIVLLLALAIILILGVLLYEYVPANKIIPEKVSYTTPEKVKQELQIDPSVDDTQVVVTYQIDSTDLNNYKKIQEYVPGKKNPFESIEKQKSNNTENNETSSENKSNAVSNSNTNSNVETNSNSDVNADTNTGYLPNRGTK